MHPRDDAEPRTRVSLQVRGRPDIQARLRFSCERSRVAVPVPGQGDLPPGEYGWQDVAVLALPDTAGLAHAVFTADTGTLLAAYADADRSAWAGHLQDLQRALVEFDDIVISILTRFSWHRDARPWTEDLERMLRTCPHSRNAGADYLAVATPAPAARWLSTYWPLGRERNIVQVAGHPEDTSETLATALSLWTWTGGSLDLHDAFTTARHATHTYWS